MKREMLNCEKNTPSMAKRVTAAAHKHFGRVGNNAVFEHGQWWICRTDGSQYSVNDADGPGTTDGFDFEMVIEPTEDY